MKCNLKNETTFAKLPATEESLITQYFDQLEVIIVITCWSTRLTF